MAPLASALVGYLSLFLQCGILILVTALAIVVRGSLGRRALDGWTLGLAANAGALALLSGFAVGRVMEGVPGIPWVTFVYAVLEDAAALSFAAAARRERGATPLPRWLLAAFGLAVGATLVAASRRPDFFGVYRVHAAGLALLLALAAWESLRVRGAGIGARLTTFAIAALAIDYGHVPLLSLFGVKFSASYPALESYVTMAFDIVLGLGIVVHATDATHAELQARNAALAEAQRALQDAVYLDALTQVPNRAAFLERIENPPASGTVAMIDVDGLKAINDRFGHAAGDATLRAAARCLRERCGSRGTIYRIGGDEFAGLWDAAAVDEVRALLVATDADLAIASEDVLAPPRISWGAAPFGPGRPFADALVAADNQLYDGRTTRRD